MRTAALALVLGVSLAACSGVSVTTDYDEAVNFASLRTYAFMDRAPGEPPPFGGNTLVANRVTAAVERELAAKGLAPATASPDFLVALHTSARDRIDVTTWPSWGYGRRGFRGAWAGDRISVNQFTEGALVVDFVDPASKDLLWRGVARTVLDAESGSKERVDDVVKELLAEFPPAAR